MRAVALYAQRPGSCVAAKMQLARGCIWLACGAAPLPEILAWHSGARRVV
jgi:hypothetical protein